MNKGKMRKLLQKYMVGALVCMMCGGSVWAGENAPPKIYYIGISTSAFGKVNENDAFAALKAWASTIEREQGLNAKLETKLLKNSAEELRAFYLNNQFDGYGLSTLELAAMGIRPDYVFVGNRGEGFTLRYVLISHVTENMRNTKTLANRSLVSCDNNQMLLLGPWLETLAAEQEDPRAIRPPTMVKNFSTAILQVFFRKADAAVVTREAFEVACELNPQLKKEIEVVFESPPLIPVVFTLKPSSGRQQDLDLLENLVLGIGNNPGGRQMLTVIQSSQMVKCPLSVLDTTLRFLEAHERLMAAENRIMETPR